MPLNQAQTPCPAENFNTYSTELPDVSVNCEEIDSWSASTDNVEYRASLQNRVMVPLRIQFSRRFEEMVTFWPLKMRKDV